MDIHYGYTKRILEFAAGILWGLLLPAAKRYNCRRNPLHVLLVFISSGKSAIQNSNASKATWRLDFPTPYLSAIDKRLLVL